MIKTMTVFGTRPEAIKMAPLVLALDQSKHFDNTVCVTGQHREMLDQIVQSFGIKVDVDLNIMKPGQDLSDVTQRVLASVRDVIRDIKPEIVFVHGDTTTCLASALAAFYEGVEIAHVEAGLRTGNLQAPFPEEANRSMVARIANYHFAPTQSARLNLIKENVSSANIFVTGNTVIDALYLMREKSSLTQSEDSVSQFIGLRLCNLLKSQAKKVILITGHRRENFGDGFQRLCSAIKELATQHDDWHFIYPVHLNPNVQKPVNEILGDLHNIHLIAPQSYEPFVWLMNRADLILTDSGGIQEEGPALGKPVLVMRDVTERPEAVEAGTVKLVGTNPKSICENVQRLLTDKMAYEAMSMSINPYGDGAATQRILDVLIGSKSNQVGSGEVWYEPINEFA